MRTSVLVGGTRAAILAMLVAGCRGQIVDLGGSHPTEAVLVDASIHGWLSGGKACTVAPPADAGATPSEDAGALGSIAGTWTGYVEAYTFPESGSDRVVVAVTAQPDGAAEATITFGDEPAPSPPTSADEAYPPGDTDAGAMSFPLPNEGFAYTALQPSFDGARLRLEAVSHEVWKPWCALQNSYATQYPDLCSCMPEGTWFFSNASSTNPTGCEFQNPDTQGWVSANCEQANNCMVGSTLCTCTARGCAVDMSHPDLVVDVRLTGGEFDGTLVGLPTSPLDLHLARSP